MAGAPEAGPLRSDATLRLLREGAVEIEGRMPWSSNATFRVDVTLEGTTRKAIYKPVRGERPLWDFPAGLHRREVAAWELSEALGWGIVPPTIVRVDAPYGEGSLQLYVDADVEQHYFTLAERDDLRHDLRAICCFDLVANNTDRKSGHCLLGVDGRVYGIDHGLCFSADPKLRTVIWDFGGDRIDDDLVAGVARVVADLPPALCELLDADEVEALVHRGESLVRHPVFPIDHTGRRYPWPLV
jgi:uncharacterized repeat protein (TIGR03843 family)